MSEICTNCKYSQWHGVWMLTCLKHQREVMGFDKCEDYERAECEGDAYP